MPVFGSEANWGTVAALQCQQPSKRVDRCCQLGIFGFDALTAVTVWDDR